MLVPEIGPGPSSLGLLAGLGETVESSSEDEEFDDFVRWESMAGRGILLECDNEA